MVIVAPMQLNGAKESLHPPRPVGKESFQRCRQLVVADQRSIVKQPLDHAARIAKKRVAQPTLQPTAKTLYAFFFDACRDLREEGFGFAVTFVQRRLLEFFLLSCSLVGCAPVASLKAARRVRPSSIAMEANFEMIWSKRCAF